jgi:hypothetical protein
MLGANLVPRRKNSRHFENIMRVSLSMNWLKEYEYIPKWLALGIPFLIYYWQRQAQNARKKRGEPLKDIDWIGILVSFFVAITFAVMLSPATDSNIRSTAMLVFFLCFFVLIRRYPF